MNKPPADANTFVILHCPSSESLVLSFSWQPIVACLQLRTQKSCPGMWKRWSVLLQWLQSVFLGNSAFPFCAPFLYIRAGYAIVLKTFSSTSFEHFSFTSCTVHVVATSHCWETLLGFSLCRLYSIPFPFLLITALQNKLNFPPSLYSNPSAIGTWLSWVPSHCWAKLYILIFFLNLIFPHKSVPSGP